MQSLMTDDDRNAKREELKANWKIASAAQFVSLFHIAFKLPEIEIEDLEEGLLDKSNVERKIVIQLFVALLKGINSKAKKENWEFYLKRLVQKKYPLEEGKSNPFPETDFDPLNKSNGFVGGLETNADSFLDDPCFQENSLDRLTSIQEQDKSVSFWDLDSSTQADIILFLCHMRLDRNDAVEAMKNMDTEILRAQSLGNDDEGNKYWYFFGTRLYKEEPAPEQELNLEDVLMQQKNKKRRGRGRPKKMQCKPRKSDGESDDLEEDGNQKKYMNADEKSTWSVICNTLDDWINFADKFKDSKSKCERSLFQVIQANFLPALNEIYQEKEKRLRQKIKELIALPMITKRETRSHNRTISNDRKSNGVDNVKENLKKDRANRLEERNRKASELPTRQTRRVLKYSDEDNDEDIPDEEMSEDDSNDTTFSSYKDRYVQDFQPLYSNGIDLKPSLLQLVSEVKLNKDAWPFVNPVQREEAPGYYEIISQPIDLSTITRKLLNNCYNSVNDLDADFRKLVSNSRLYNGEGGPTKMAHNVYNLFLGGLNKILEINGIKQFHVADNKEANKVKGSTKRSRSKTISKRRMKSEEGGKKKKIAHMEGLELLSREAKLSVENSNRNFKGIYTYGKQNNSNLKVMLIHNNSRDAIERLTSESSNQENDEESNNSSSLMGDVRENPMEDFDVCNNSGSFSGSNDYLESRSNDDNSNQSVFMDEDNQNVEGDDALKDSHEESNGNVSDDVQENDRKASNSSTEGLLHGMANILDECSNQSITNGNISFTRETVYSSGEVNTSPGGRSLQSTQSRSSDSSTPENTQKASPESSPYVQSSIVDKHVPFFQDSMGIQTDFSFPSDNSQQSTVDASILGFSSFGSVPSRISPELSNQSQSKQTTPPPGNTLASFTTHLSPNVSPKGMAPLAISQPLQISPTYDKVFSYQNPVQIMKPEPNKFPTMKVSLPPSTGNILVIPDKTDPNKMTFHLIAQPHADPSQTIQSSGELRANISPEIIRNEVTESSGDKLYKDSLSPTMPKRTSPILELPQFQSAPFGLPIVPQPPATSNYSSLLKPVTSYPNFTSNSSYPSIPAPSMPSFPAMPVPTMSSFQPLSSSPTSSFPSFSAPSMSNSFIPVSSSTVSTSNSFLPSNTSPTYAHKYDQQLIKPKPSNYHISNGNQDSVVRSSYADNLNLMPQSSSCFNTKSSTVASSVLSDNKQSRGSKSSAKKGVTVAEKLKAVSSSYHHPGSVISNGNGQFEILMPAADGNHQFSRFQAPEKLTNQNVLKPFQNSNAPSTIYTPAYPSSLQNYGLSTTPHIVYAQVNPNQPSQFINIPNYMIASQSMFQHPMNPSIVNVQPYQIPNRPVVPMDLNGR